MLKRQIFYRFTFIVSGCLFGAAYGCAAQAPRAPQEEEEEPNEPPPEEPSALPQPEICKRYINCIAAAVPEALPGALDSLGPSGTCWKRTPAEAEACALSCEKGMEIQAAATSAPECNECLSNADCKDPSKPTCTKSGVCRECDCEGPCQIADDCGDVYSYDECVETECSYYCTQKECF
ncbi:MAG TPA: hypothetical protein VM694_12550 [Polyangium sp.]|nr:hypothetical protein [Polyangium sp.]